MDMTLFSLFLLVFIILNLDKRMWYNIIYDGYICHSNKSQSYNMKKIIEGFGIDDVI